MPLRRVSPHVGRRWARLIQTGSRCRAVLCTIAMLEFARLNRKKIAQCEREGITEDMASEFVERGDASPLYRSVRSYCKPDVARPMDN